MPEDSSRAFRGFKPAATRFFEDLAQNQDRIWFNAHKAEYERDVKAPMEALLLALTQRLATTTLPLVGDPKRSVFRLNRDVRFSADKRPYKTHAGAVLSRDGSKSSPGLLYVHFAADEVFAAAGFYMPMPDQLKPMRAAMAADPEGWLAVRRGLDGHGLALLRENALVRLPKGYEDAPAALHEDLRLKSWAASKRFPLRVARSAELVEAVAEVALGCADLLEFGWRALEAG